MRCGRMVRKQLRPKDGHRKSSWRCAVCNSELGVQKYAASMPALGEAIAAMHDPVVDEDAALG